MSIAACSSLILPTRLRKRNRAEPESESSERRKYRKRAPNVFCNECSTLDLQKAVDSIQTLSEDPRRIVFLANVGQRYRQPLRSDCELCRILAISRVDRTSFLPIGREDDEDTDKLCAFSFLGIYKGTNYWGNEAERWHTENDSVLLAVVPSLFGSPYVHWKVLQEHAHQNGYVICCRMEASRSQALAPRIIPPYLEPSQILHWLRYCKRHHRKLCPQMGSTMEELRLIDCENLTLTKASDGAIYAALSYVWGSRYRWEEKDPGSVDDCARLPTSLPALILDSIEVAKSLGIRYLWVDKYCIDQGNEERKNEQIGHMDLIYKNAELTIVAAAGVDEDYGLPGMGHRARLVQPQVICKKFSVISTMKDPHVSIQSSKWWTRGWTFQEAVLSTRRLVFTDEQIYFECNAMNCHESLTGCLDKLHRQDRSRFRPFLRAGIFGRNERNDSPLHGTFAGEELDTIELYLLFLTAIEQYSARELRYDSDALNAFLGVMRMFEKRESQICQRWGIPYLIPESNADFLQRCWYAVTGLSWFHVHSCWSRTNAPRRRPDLPSWAWAGWVGEVSYPAHSLTIDGRQFNVQRMPYVWDVDGYGAWERMSDVHEEPVRVLILGAFLLQPSAFSFDCVSNKWRFLGGFPTELKMSTGPDTPAQFFDELRAGKRWCCVYLGKFHGPHESCRLAMVLELHGPSGLWAQRASRAGMFVIHPEKEGDETRSMSLSEETVDLFLVKYRERFHVV